MNNIYDRNLDLREGTADFFVVNSVFNNARVLELGCATGYITKYLKYVKECETSAIEINSDALNNLKPILEYSINADLDKVDEWIDSIPDYYFNFIICQDVLEHLKNPIDVLKKLKLKLINKGVFLISIPNVSHNTIIMQLLKNRFDYKDIGLLDRTHIRFYTKETFSDEVDSIDLKRLQHYFTYLIPAGTGWGTKYKDHSIEERELLFKSVDGHIFQNLFVLGRKEDFINVSEAPLKVCDYSSYDEVTIFEVDREYSYYYDNNTLLKHLVHRDCEKLIIEPTIRPYEYTIDVLINKEKYSLWSFSVNDGTINTKNGNFVNLDKQKIIINQKLHKDDILEIKINRINNAFIELKKGNFDMKNELNSLKDKIDDFDIVSFDIFDTLVLRNVLFPKDIFKILDEFVKKHYGVKDFYQVRIDCEMKTRINSCNEDIDIYEIYDTISKHLGINCNNIMQKELELEKQFIVINPFMKIVYDYAIETGKKVYIISDMYLSKQFLSDKLNELGYNNYTELFVSSEVKKTKATKTIYKYIINNYDLQPDKWLHIGDNYEADCINAEKFKINSYYYKAVRERANQYDEDINIKSSIMKAIQYNKIYSGLEIPYWEKFGIEYIAPIYYGFSDWIARINKNNDNVVFLARDGYMPKRVFDKLKVKRNLDNIESIYLYSSRKAFQLPSMAYMKKGELIEYLTQWNEAFGHIFTIEELFHNAGLDIEEYWEVINQFGFSEKTDIITHETRHNAKKMISFLYDDIVANMKEKCLLVEEFLMQEGIMKFKKVNIVDIGWRGSIQYSIKKMVEHYNKTNNINTTQDIKGFYLGTNQFVYPEIVDDTFGYYFDYSIPWVHSSFCLDNIMMYEFIFTCPSPQLSHFERKEGKIVPVFRDFIENVEYTSVFQNAALKIIDEFIDFDDYISGISVDDCTLPYRNFIIEKKYNDMVEFKKITNYVSYDADKKPYVTSYSKEQILNSFETVWKEIEFNLWRYSFVIEGINNSEEFDRFLKHNNIDRFSSSQVKESKLITKSRLKKAIKHPIKAIRLSMKIVLNRILA